MFVFTINLPFFENNCKAKTTQQRVIKEYITLNALRGSDTLI